MILYKQKLNIPDYLYHDPIIQDSNKNTIAMLYL